MSGGHGFRGHAPHIHWFDGSVVRKGWSNFAALHVLGFIIDGFLELAESYLHNVLPLMTGSTWYFNSGPGTCIWIKIEDDGGCVNMQIKLC